MNDQERIRGWVRFSLSAHLWNQHRVHQSDFPGLSFEQISEIHRRYNCPPGESRKYLGCHMRLVPRRSPRPPKRRR